MMVNVALVTLFDEDSQKEMMINVVTLSSRKAESKAYDRPRIGHTFFTKADSRTR
jgi:hypothetical protein